MSQETDFLVLYPHLKNAQEQVASLVGLLDKVTSLEEGPDADWIPVLHEACEGVLTALKADALQKLDLTAFAGATNAALTVETSFHQGEGLLFDAYREAAPAAARVDEYVRALAANAFGPWGGYFFQLCADNLSPDHFDPNNYVKDAGQRRPCYERDRLWLQWKAEREWGPAKVRDEWNRMTQEERKACCPACANAIGKGEDGRDVVKKALLRAKLESRFI